MSRVSLALFYSPEWCTACSASPLSDDQRAALREITKGHQQPPFVRELSRILSEKSEEQAFFNELKKRFVNDHFYMVLSADGHIVGLVSFSGVGDQAGPAWFIAPEYAGRRYGKAAVKELACEMKRHGIRHIYLTPLDPCLCGRCDPNSHEWSGRLLTDLRDLIKDNHEK